MKNISKTINKTVVKNTYRWILILLDILVKDFLSYQVDMQKMDQRYYYISDIIRMISQNYPDFEDMGYDRQNAEALERGFQKICTSILNMVDAIDAKVDPHNLGIEIAEKLSIFDNLKDRMNDEIVKYLVYLPEIIKGFCVVYKPVLEKQNRMKYL